MSSCLTPYERNEKAFNDALIHFNIDRSLTMGEIRAELLLLRLEADGKKKDVIEACLLFMKKAYSV